MVGVCSRAGGITCAQTNKILIGNSGSVWQLGRSKYSREDTIKELGTENVGYVHVAQEYQPLRSVFAVYAFVLIQIIFGFPSIKVMS